MLLVIRRGPVPGGRASTVLDLSVDPPRILREGPVSAAELGRVLGAEPSLA